MIAFALGLLSKLGSKVTIYLVGGILLVLAITITYHHWKSSIEQQALLQVQAAQLKQALQENQDYQKKVADLQTWVDTLKQEVADEGAQISDQTTRINTMIQGEADRPSSQVLKDVVKAYRGDK